MLFVYSRFMDLPEFLLLFSTPFGTFVFFRSVLLVLIKTDL